jgi:hypothetical protein
LQRPGTHRQLFDSILKRGLEARRSFDPNGCPHEATLAAYCDRSISGPQVHQLEEHFSNCARCQGTLAAMARARTAQHSIGGRSLTRRWELYAAVAAAAAGISIAVGLMQRGRVIAPAANLIPESAAPEQAGNEPALKGPQAGPQIAFNEPYNEQAQGNAAAKGRAPVENPPGAVRKRGLQLNPAGAEGAGQAKQKEEISPSKTFSENPQAESAAVPPAALPAQAPPLAPLMPEPRLAARAPTGPALGAPMGGFAGFGAAPSGAGLASVPQAFSVRTADNVERWRLGANGSIEHLASDGSWEPQISGVAAALRAGAASSPTTCWVAGAGGTILRTTDGGEHWQKINSPTSADLVSIVAVDASAATVMTADGHRFSTIDGGRSWRQT